MNYVIENAQSSFFGREQQKSFCITGDTVVYTHSHFDYYSYLRMNIDNFIISPGHVMIDFSLNTIVDFLQFKERMKQLLRSGCTTVITAVDISYEANFLTQLKKGKHSLINSSIDFVVGGRIPLSKLTPTIIRSCRKHKVPILFVEINEETDLRVVQWQWIRDELFPYSVNIVPIWKMKSSTWKQKKLEQIWVRLLAENKIYTIGTCPEEQSPLSEAFLKDVGLYPRKGSLLAGSDADYILWHQQKEATKNIVLSKPDIVCSHGKVKIAGDYSNIQPGCGKEIIIHVPRKFRSIEDAFDTRPIIIDYYD